MVSLTKKCILIRSWYSHTMVCPKVSELASRRENSKWYSSLPLGTVVSLSEFCRHNPLCCVSSVYCCKRIFRYRLSPETFGYTVVCWTEIIALMSETRLWLPIISGSNGFRDPLIRFYSLASNLIMGWKAYTKLITHLLIWKVWMVTLGGLSGDPKPNRC
jgi:hypothetical protein